MNLNDLKQNFLKVTGRIDQRFRIQFLPLLPQATINTGFFQCKKLNVAFVSGFGYTANQLTHLHIFIS